MRAAALALVTVSSLALGGCFQSSTLITVNGDGSGTLEQTLVFGGAALVQMRQIAPMTGTSSRAFDPFPEEQARQLAASLGPDVRYVSSTPITTAEGLGRKATYAFPDINQLRINEQPPAPGGVSIRSKTLNTEQDIRFALAPQADGHLLLRILFPPAPRPTPPPKGPPPIVTADQVEQAKMMFAGARLSIAVQPSGEVVKTSSPWVDGRRVTLFDLQFDQLMIDDATVARLQGIHSVEEGKAALKDVPGAKINAGSEITIEFIPKK